MFRQASVKQWRDVVASVLAQMGVACWDYDLASGELWWSPNAGPLLDRPEGFTPSTFEEADRLFVPDQSRPKGQESILEALKSGPVETERQARLPDGTLRWVGHRYFLMTDGNASPVRLAGMMMDIEARKRRELENEVLSKAGRVLTKSLDENATSRAIARLLVPDLADWCIVDLFDDGRLKPIAIAHVDADKVRWAEAIRAEYPPDIDSQEGAARVARTGEPELYEVITDEMLQVAARDERHLEILRSVGFRSAMLVPLHSRKEVIGIATLVMSDSERRFDEESLQFARRIAPPIAASIHNARLHNRLGQALANERSAVETLQRGLIPGPLPDIDGIVLAAHYEIGGSDKVGGDWFEVVPIGAGRIGLVIGDVMGRGVEAVAAMSMFRNALRAFLIEGHGPGDSLKLLDKIATNGDSERGDLATIGCFIYEAGSRGLTWSTAGHLPAMIRREDGEVEPLWERPEPPLGAGGGEYSESHLSLPAQTMLLLYTDGLIERRGEIIDSSIQRLRAELRSAPEKPADVVSHLLERLPTYPSRDDVALLAALFV